METGECMGAHLAVMMLGQWNKRMETGECMGAHLDAHLTLHIWHLNKKHQNSK
jgi:hypothetical protein